MGREIINSILPQPFQEVTAWSSTFPFSWSLPRVVTGLVWAGRTPAYFKPRNGSAEDGQLARRCPPEPILVEYARSFFPIILLVLVIRSFLYEPFRIPSDSMMPTLLDGDFIFVNKFKYGLRLPVVNTEIVPLG